MTQESWTTWAKNCPINEVTGDGRSCGRCWHYLGVDGVTCPRHGDVSAAAKKYAETGKLTMETDHNPKLKAAIARNHATIQATRRITRQLAGWCSWGWLLEPWSQDLRPGGFMLSALFADGLLASFKPRRLVWLLTAKNTVINGSAN